MRMGLERSDELPHRLCKGEIEVITIEEDE
jgi:hypothetical protein